MNKDLEDLLESSRKLVESMTPEQREAMHKAQRESWVRSIVDWPKPNYKWVDGVKVYASMEDYYND